MWDFSFFLNSILLGIGLAMDAFTVSIAVGMGSANADAGKTFLPAAVFGLFQMGMPLLGWFCVHTISDHFQAFRRWTPWISLILLCFLGGKMIWEGIRKKDIGSMRAFSLSALLIQGVATSIDALSVGFTIDTFPWFQALAEASIIGAITFGLCFAALHIGKAVGRKLKHKALIVGGVILIAIGIEIWVKNGLMA